MRVFFCRVVECVLEDSVGNVPLLILRGRVLPVRGLPMRAVVVDVRWAAGGGRAAATVTTSVHD